MRNTKKIALGGILAAVAVVIMCLGGLIPVATYVTPVLCCLVCQLVLVFCGKKIAWTWYVAVSVLTLLLGPDKEAVIIYLVLGYYPCIKGYLDNLKFGLVLKLLIFNLSILLCYSVMMYVLGMNSIRQEMSSFGVAGTIILLIFGNVVFYLLDKALWMFSRKILNR